MTKLIKYDAAKKALSAAVRVDEVLKIRDVAKQFEAASKVAKDRQMMADSSEIVRRAEFRLSELVDAQRKTVGLASGKEGKRKALGIPKTPRDRTTLKEAGIDKNLAKRVRRAGAIAKKGEKAIEAEIERTRAAATSSLDKPSPAEKAERRADRERELGSKILAFPKKQYGIIYADPPWRFEVYDDETGMDRSAENQYPTMTVAEICKLKIPTAEDCVLFLWTTNPMLPEALQVVEAWGFTYKTNFVWVKDKIGTGYWNRNQHELLFVATKGSIPAPAPGQQYSSVIEAPRGKHSVKPFTAREMIDDMFPTIPRLELFARERFAGWDVWGKEAPEEAA